MPVLEELNEGAISREAVKEMKSGKASGLDGFRWSVNRKVVWQY